MADVPKSKKHKVLCPECDTEVDITRDDDGDDVGVCENCSLNVGRLLTKRRYDKALAVMNEREEKEAGATKKKKKEGFWS